MLFNLKILPEFFEPLQAGLKNFEIRAEDDKVFSVGDVLVLLEWNGKEFTGRKAVRIVTYCLRGEPFVPAGYVVMSLKTEGGEEKDVKA